MQYYAWCDASWKNGRSFVGYIIKNTSGKIISMGRSRLTDITNNNDAELIGIAHLLNHIISLKLDNVIIFNDCKPVIDNIRKAKVKGNFWIKRSHAFSSINKIVEKIGNVQFEWIPRQMNTTADFLSRPFKGKPKITKLSSYTLKKRNIHANTRDWNRFTISNRIRKSYQKYSPKSFNKCKSNDMVNYKITRCIELGNITIHSKNQFTAQYANLLICVENDVVQSIKRGPNIPGFHKKKDLIKKAWEHEYPFISQETTIKLAN